MEPIINPWIFYLIDVIDNIHIISVILSCAVVGVFIMVLVTIEADGSSELAESSTKRKLGLVLVICSILALVTPSKTVMYQMLVSSYVTSNNIDTVTNNIVDKIVDSAIKIKNGQEVENE